MAKAIATGVAVGVGVGGGTVLANHLVNQSCADLFKSLSNLLVLPFLSRSVICNAYCVPAHAVNDY